MKTPIEMRVLALFREGIEAYSISEIARATKAAYPHAHAAVTEMIAEGILESRTIGRAIYVWPNLKNPMARNTLARAFIEKREQLFTSPNEQNLQKEIHRLFLENHGILCVIQKESQLFFVVNSHKTDVSILRSTSLLNIFFFTPHEFKQTLLASPALLCGNNLLAGEERLLLIIGSIHKELLFNHARLFRGEDKAKEEHGTLKIKERENVGESKKNKSEKSKKREQKSQVQEVRA